MKKSLWFLLLASFLFTSCGDDDEVVDPEEENEEELITTVTLTLTPTAGGDVVTATFQDLDGDGGNAPTQPQAVTLAANTDYTATLNFLNEAESPVEVVTTEIVEEADEHFICFDAQGINVTVNRADEVGVVSLWSAGAAGTGTVIVTLKHQPDGSKNGTCAPGSTDAEVKFPVIVQ